MSVFFITNKLRCYKTEELKDESVVDISKNKKTNDCEKIENKSKVDFFNEDERKGLKKGFLNFFGLKNVGEILSEIKENRKKQEEECEKKLQRQQFVKEKFDAILKRNQEETQEETTVNEVKPVKTKQIKNISLRDNLFFITSKQNNEINENLNAFRYLLAFDVKNKYISQVDKEAFQNNKRYCIINEILKKNDFLKNDFTSKLSYNLNLFSDDLDQTILYSLLLTSKQNFNHKLFSDLRVSLNPDQSLLKKIEIINLEAVSPLIYFPINETLSINSISYKNLDSFTKRLQFDLIGRYYCFNFKLKLLNEINSPCYYDGWFFVSPYLKSDYILTNLYGPNANFLKAHKQYEQSKKMINFKEFIHNINKKEKPQIINFFINKFKNIKNNLANKIKNVKNGFLIFIFFAFLTMFSFIFKNFMNINQNSKLDKNQTEKTNSEKETIELENENNSEEELTSQTE